MALSRKVKKKFAMSTMMKESTTDSVVAKPTPSAPWA